MESWVTHFLDIDNWPNVVRVAQRYNKDLWLTFLVSFLPLLPFFKPSDCVMTSTPWGGTGHLYRDGWFFMPIEPHLMMALCTDCGEEAQTSVQNGWRCQTYVWVTWFKPCWNCVPGRQAALRGLSGQSWFQKGWNQTFIRLEMPDSQWKLPWWKEPECRGFWCGQGCCWTPIVPGNIQCISGSYSRQ